MFADGTCIRTRVRGVQVPRDRLGSETMAGAVPVRIDWAVVEVLARPLNASRNIGSMSITPNPLRVCSPFQQEQRQRIAGRAHLGTFWRVNSVPVRVKYKNDACSGQVQAQRQLADGEIHERFVPCGERDWRTARTGSPASRSQQLMKVGTQVGAHVSNKRKSAYKLRPAAVALRHEFHAGRSAGGPAEIARTGLEATEEAAPRYQDDGRSRFEARADQACHTQVMGEIAAGSAEVQHRHGLPEETWHSPCSDCE